ncbi:DEAH box polypeptide 35 [Capsaspora owczarzaki ATCC 30864]|uniref:RNA helicase n=1 Tax=Capsaspora owczarzaki (strain ATCC 30864) TaxID=595528 RepID=A0A0D2U2L1_CAPO3|nr:DEAH box polypeptide 35 [Capsaspora owczarzaki ATCC 30864]KJE89436.1 DEAH box polypeptide 35 [Capsaspora owczarzaki ATCC 30864]|eukprot:XP_004365774.1 DEAH box polypeptide 35 [Capsaspora owczarzaki ATCC 30864]
MAGSGMVFWKPGTIAPGSLVDRVPSSSSSTSLASDGRDAVAGGSIAAVYNPNSRLAIAEQRSRLPIAAVRSNILHMLEQYQVLIVVGETGSGKTTQIPQYLHEAGWTAGDRVVACTQPRRVAATSVATRTAEEMGETVGDLVGYSIRFDDVTTPGKTKIKFMTDGLLLREMMATPLLNQYSVIMLDEAHERTIATELLLGLLRKVLRKRPEMRVIVSSATLDAEAFRSHFNLNTDASDPSKDTAAILTVPGRTFPVDVQYLSQPTPDYIKAAVDAVMNIHTEEPAGDVLVFLTGQDEIERAITLLNDRVDALLVDAAAAKRRYQQQQQQHHHGDRGRLAAPPASYMNMRVLPLHGALPFQEQLAAFEAPPRGTRKVVISTNVAEASVTIDGIAYVVDSCHVKLMVYRPDAGHESLMIVPISRASAQQRAGRAGRTRPGKALRLCTESDYCTLLPERSVPEIQRVELAPVLLQLKALGIDNLLHFDFLSPPVTETVARALELLFALGALESNGRLAIPLGIRMAELPIPVMQAKMLLASAELGCSEEIVTIAAMLQVQNLFSSSASNRDASGSDFAASGNAVVDAARSRFGVTEGDHLTLLNVYLAYSQHGVGQHGDKWCGRMNLNPRAMQRAVQIRHQLMRYLTKFGVAIESAFGKHRSRNSQSRNPSDDEATAAAQTIRRCIAAGYFANAARLKPDGSYRSLRYDLDLAIHPSSVLYYQVTQKLHRPLPPPKYVVFHEIVQTTRTFMRDITAIEPEWLLELAPHFYQKPAMQAVGPSSSSVEPGSVSASLLGETWMDNFAVSRKKPRAL